MNVKKVLVWAAVIVLAIIAFRALKGRKMAA